MIQLLLHLLGDYVLQSQWMAENKTKRSVPAAVHALVYSLPFVLLPFLLAGTKVEYSCSPKAFAFILVTHFLIDRFSLAKYLVYAKNQISPYAFTFIELDEVEAESGDEYFVERVKEAHRLEWKNCRATGYPADVPAWLAVWLLIAADNTLHLCLNWYALTFL